MSGFVDEEGVYHNVDRMMDRLNEDLKSNSEKEYIQVPVYFYHTEERVKVFDINLMQSEFADRLNKYQKLNEINFKNNK
jgi:hypothetical protein